MDGIKLNEWRAMKVSKFGLLLAFGRKGLGALGKGLDLALRNHILTGESSVEREGFSKKAPKVKIKFGTIQNSLGIYFKQSCIPVLVYLCLIETDRVLNRESKE